MKDVKQVGGPTAKKSNQKKHTWCLTVPVDLEPVLAKIVTQGGLGPVTYAEVVYYNGDEWLSFCGSNTFDDGEIVTQWVYVEDAFNG